MQETLFILNIEHLQNRVSTNSAWISNTSKVVDGIREINRISNSKFGIKLISTLEALKDLMKSKLKGVLLFNTHGEVIPIPREFGHNEFLKKMGDKMYDCGWTIINATGIPFCYYWQGEDKGIALTNNNDLYGGLNNVFYRTSMSVKGILPAINILSGEGAMALRGSNISLPEQISISRCMILQNALPKTVFYGMSDMYGAASIPVGNGYLIFNGMWTLDLGTSPNPHTDRLLGKIATAYLVYTRRKLTQPPNTIYELKDLISIIEKNLGFMLRKQNKPTGRKGEMLLQDQIENNDSGGFIPDKDKFVSGIHDNSSYVWVVVIKP